MNTLLQAISNRIKTNQNVLLVVVGKARYGKSYFAGKLIEQLLKLDLGLKFEEKNVLYWADDLLEIIKNSQKDIILIDESSHEFDRKRWFSIQNHILTVLNATQGFRQNVMIVITQNRRLLSSTVWYMADFYVRMRKFMTSKGHLLPEPIFFAKLYYNNENPMAEADPKWMGDAFSTMKIEAPSEAIRTLLDRKGLEFKHDIPDKLQKLGKTPPLPSLEIKTKEELGALLASGLKGEQWNQVYKFYKNME